LGGSREGKGKEVKPSYIGSTLTENRHGLVVVEGKLGSAKGTFEREAQMIVPCAPGSRRLTLGADKTMCTSSSMILRGRPASGRLALWRVYHTSANFVDRI